MQQVFAHPLPESWAPHEVVQDSISAEGLELHRVGIATRSPSGEEITGAAVDLGVTPLARGYFELLERVSTLESIASPRRILSRTRTGEVTGHHAPSDVFCESTEPHRWRYARSNGVAIHDSWAVACERAFYELVERDRVLRAWYGEVDPRRVELPPSSWLVRLPSYDCRAYRFPPLEGTTWSLGVEVVGVFGFPLRDGLPLLLGYGARAEVDQALAAAARESLQALGFLWGEELPSSPPPLGPTAGAHAEALMYPGRQQVVRAWLDGGHGMFAPSASLRDDRADATVFFDLTPDWLDGPRVAKAFSPCAAPLAFGDSPFVQHLPADLHAHPIP